MLTLRQIEVIRAILLTGTVKGAADLLGVSAPGISRVMKHTESQLGLRLFSRAHGRFAPTDEAREIFTQINEVFAKVENLQESIDMLKRGESRVFALASVPSIAQHILPCAVRRMRARYPDLRLSVDQTKIEETIDFLLMRKVELVANSFKIDHPGLSSQPLGTGRVMALLPEGHELTQESTVSVSDLARYPMIGITPSDPYGQILARPLRDADLPVQFEIEARFGQTLQALVAQGTGVALIDEFSVAGPLLPGLAVRPLREPTSFRTYAVVNVEYPLSIFAETMIAYLKQEMRSPHRQGSEVSR
ncbi:LysR family transcriptional regulator [Thioclava pacifica]|uniref:HTH lysR-type domain-containing protein n=1 Tax=Thioclava pacifica DSM 10166 TaxID=1353537 RepID=A0A074K1F2_9RHOB|nr:LysR family transcriptional regulator [Thioclava pacifica]KEO55422.1 hypothetical protein TP2_15385 [Thioclava pacifica DSM 10166]